MENKKNDVRDREYRTSRVLDAPVEMVWEVWTTPAHVEQWWGPRGFTSKIDRMEVRPGGEWNMVIEGPDGKEYVVRSVYKEVAPLKRLVYEVHDHVSGLTFTVTVELEAQGAKTLLNSHTLFETAEQCIRMVKTLKADEGFRQTLDRLNDFLLVRIKNK
jgi:uncharacterized protein YndB with AHSA1/START domain